MNAPLPIDFSAEFEPLWTLQDVAEATGGQILMLAGMAVQDTFISGLSIDTRTLQAGDMFIALVGDVTDGHLYLEAAMQAGASCCLVSELPENSLLTAPLIFVPDTLIALQALGRHRRTAVTNPIIGVTGSVGKTGTKDMLRYMLGASGKTHAAVESFNNHWGVPLTLARMPLDSEFGVLEMGMNKAGEIHALGQMVRPDIAIITTIAPAHLEFFRDVEAIADAKAEIFDTMNSGRTKGGIGILNRDNPHFERLQAHAKAQGVDTMYTFGRHPSADARLLDYIPPTHTTPAIIKAEFLGQPIQYALSLVGEHHGLNSLAALLAVHAAGADITAAMHSLADLHITSGRGEYIPLTISDNRKIHIVNDSYNANPTSMRAAFATLKSFESQIKTESPPRLVAILGDMLELGEQSAALHKGLIDDIAKAGVESVFCCGSLMRHLYDDLPVSMQGAWFPTAEELCAQLSLYLMDGDIILCKGSKGSKISKAVTTLKALAVSL